MNDRAVTPHRRTATAPSTPAQRLIELQQHINQTEVALAAAQARVAELERDYDRWHRMTDTSFGGIPMAQIWADLRLWEALLNENPQVEAVFEIGTWQGGFSWWLWAQCEARDLWFETFDAVEPERNLPPNSFLRWDVFALSSSLGLRFRAYEPCVVFCDGGNKPRELKTFSAELRSRESLLVVHDWGTEMLPEDVPDTVEMVYGDFCEELGSISRVFRLKENDEPQRR